MQCELPYGHEGEHACPNAVEGFRQARQYEPVPGGVRQPVGHLDTRVRVFYKGSVATTGDFQAELAKDGTDMGQKEAIAAEAAHPDPTTKTQWFARATKESPPEWQGLRLKNAQLREATAAFHPMAQEERTREFVGGYFDALPMLAAAGEDEEYVGEFAEDMFP